MSKEKAREVTLRVAEAKPKDSGKKRVRIDVDTMKYLGLESGDVVEIEGKKKTVATVWPALPEDTGLEVIRMDGLIRKNAGVNIGERVVVRKANTRPATRVKLAPTTYIGNDESLKRHVKKRLVGTPVMEGDIVIVQVIGQAIQLQVVDVRPRGAVIVMEDTNVDVLDKPVSLSSMPKVTYEDIGGLSHVVAKVRELVELPLRYPELFKRLGIDPPKGILLYGPPGTGKTLLAKAVANEVDAHFIAVNGPEIMSKFYGESEQRLREIFKEAEENAPSIIFFDEIDAIAPKREEVTGEVEKRVVAQLLTLMDGLKERGKVIVIGATNRPDAVDPALRRPGRFDREIEVPMPDKQGRLEILQIHTRHMPLAEDVDLEKLADITKGYTGADLAALAREAAMQALRRYLPEIDLSQRTLPPELLEKIVVKMSDFMEVYKEITPSGLREVQIEMPDVRWSDIGGLEEVKKELIDMVEKPMKFPEVYIKAGIRPPKGVLLFGPPGTGKTLLAKAVATESGANFIAVRGPEIMSKWVGESEKLIRDIFKKARQYAPAIIFFDEIDAIAYARGIDEGSKVVERIVSQLLTEIDWISEIQNVIVMAATNRPDMIDPALLRPGRLGKLIYVPPPDEQARLQILRIHTRKTPLASDVDLEEIAKMTDGYTGADLEALLKEATMLAVRESITAPIIRWAHIEEAMKKVRPSVTKQMVEFYSRWLETARQVRAERRRETTTITF
ncbi:MAG: CDC48 family AAA ATPase [Acidilobaceae archaeon]|nr:CDC48 family AAA ATPase [Acidilobaceae archaeon]MCX8165010.1 CDC48 family AAA ATPase [Acidilobaceae archaeon]MDW7974473.1 CDC48 family AAA ATPase [Sulfolobales archaeon]